jgi:purine-binding chemotaxis protein CheW
MSATEIQLQTTCQLVVCSLGEEEYALPIAQVREILRASEPRPVASDVPWMRGVISLRGRLLPVYDLATRLGVAAAQGARAKIVVVEPTGVEPAGLVVDDVVEVMTVATAQIEEVAATSADGRPSAVVKLGERLVLLLDGEALLARSEDPDPPEDGDARPDA